MNIELCIEELVLYDFRPGDRGRIAQAVERELERLFAEQGIPPSLAHGQQISALGSLALEGTPSSQANIIGRQIAQALYKGLNT